MANQMRHATNCITKTVSPSTAMPTPLRVSDYHQTIDKLSAYHGFLAPYYLHNLLTNPDAGHAFWLDFYQLLQPNEAAKHTALLRYQYPVIDHNLSQQKSTPDFLQQVLAALNGYNQALATCSHLKYSGYFQFATHSCRDLMQLLKNTLQRPISISTLTGQWIRLETTEQTQLGKQNHRLASATYLGQYAWHGQHGITINIGPVSYTDYNALLPHTEAHAYLCQLIKQYLPQGTQFTLNVQLDKSTLPPFWLKHAEPRRLGQQTFL